MYLRATTAALTLAAALFAFAQPFNSIATSFHENNP